MSSRKTNWNRRALLAGGALAVAAWVKGVPYLLSLGEPALVFDDLPELAPFRRLRGTTSVSRGSAILAGLHTDAEAARSRAEDQALVRADLCSAFYGSTRPDRLSVAMFSDFNCPSCRVMDDRLFDLQAQEPDRFRIVRHQLPLLGAASVTASRAVLAADLQGGYRAMHQRLARTSARTDMRLVSAIAEDIGLDQDRLLEDMHSVAIDQHLRRTAALAAVFGFYGTPAFAIGRTVFMGVLSETRLRDLMDLEADSPC